MSELLWSNASALTLASYVTVFFQVSFLYLVLLNRRTRVLAAVAGCFSHVAIIVTMGLVTFGLFMIAADLVLITDGEYRRFGAWVRVRGSTRDAGVAPNDRSTREDDRNRIARRQQASAERLQQVAARGPRGALAAADEGDRAQCRAGADVQQDR